ncbi:MAG: recombinase family protein [Oscillospiraceae bacterium]
MDIFEIRQQLRFKTIYEIPLRVTYYARVSSESDEQLNSLGNQIAYYEHFIRKNLAWTFVPGYIDEGLSGISTKRRENFNRMIDDAAEDRFDLVITKEISRFARNTLDSIQFTRQLLSHGVGVFFQNDNINTLDEDAELRLSIMSSIAQDELRKLSSRVKFGHQQAIKSHVVLGNSSIFGYRKDNKRLVIDETQAPMVRELFALYATDQYSMKQIETLFWNKGYRNTRGNRITHSTMSNMIANPKYKGYYVGNKVKVVDMFTKKQKFLPPEEWVMFKDETGEIVPAIVDEELWDRANEILRRRSEDVKSRQGVCNHANLLTGKLFCTCCGVPYYRRESKDRHGNKNSKWICSGKIKNGADSCPSFPIYEEEIRPVLFGVFEDTQASAEAMIEEYVRLYNEQTDHGALPQKIAAQQKIIDFGNQKLAKLLQFNITGQITDDEYLSQAKLCRKEIADAEAEIRELDSLSESTGEFKKHIEAIRATLRQAQADAAQGMISKQFVDQYIDKIFVTPVDEETMRLDVRIFTGESSERFFRKLSFRASRMSAAPPEEGKNPEASAVSELSVSAGQTTPELTADHENPVTSTACGSGNSTGHTFKKMIQAYEDGMK